MASQKNGFFKSSLIVFFIIVMTYLFVILFLNQGTREVQKNGDSQSLQTISRADVETIHQPVLSTLLLQNEILLNDGQYYFVVNELPDRYQVITPESLLNRTMVFVNFPFLLLILGLFVFHTYFARKKIKQQQSIIEQLNSQAEQLLFAFNYSNPAGGLKKTSQNLNPSRETSKDTPAQLKLEAELNPAQDKLTGLIDRHAYLARLEIELKVAESENTRKALLFIDLDGFKQVNDVYGHSFGDEILVQVAERLRTTVRCQSISSIDPDTMLEMNISRLGGDEFSVFIEDLSSNNRVQEVAENILHEIEKDFDLGNKIVKISASIGIAYYPESASSPQALLQMADVAMYRAKSDGRGISRVYSPDMGKEMRRYHYLIEELRQAVESKNFILHFQPIVLVDDCSIDYFEALVRWPHREEGMIYPSEFIPIAEESYLILELGDWILEESCRQMSAWHNAGMRNVRISVNVSGVQLKHRALHEWVMAVLEKTGLSPKALMLEITESCMIEASPETIEQLSLLRKEGIIISIDDFGTGFSSLSTLAELPADVIKIDKLFIDQAHDNPKFGKVLESISELGKNLDLKMVAEGVEQAEQFAFVKKLGIQCVQGFLISRPETSRNIGAKILEQNLSLLASSGTSVWLPKEDDSGEEQQLKSSSKWS